MLWNPYFDTKSYSWLVYFIIKREFLRKFLYLENVFKKFWKDIWANFCEVVKVKAPFAFFDGKRSALTCLEIGIPTLWDLVRPQGRPVWVYRVNRKFCLYSEFIYFYSSQLANCEEELNESKDLNAFLQEQIEEIKMQVIQIFLLKKLHCGRWE